MLAYLDALIDALTLRDVAEVQRLLAHPLARILPDECRVEAFALTQGQADALAAPLRVMQLRRQTAELLRDTSPAVETADRAVLEGAPAEIPAAETPRSPRAHPTARPRRPARLVQMELPLSA